MSIESAIEGTAQGNTTRDKQRTRLHGRIVAVHVDNQKPMDSYITVEAESKNNLGQFSGTYNISLNSELDYQQRTKHAMKAQESGSGICGSLINDRMMRSKGKPVLLSNFELTGDHVGTCRWIDFSRKEVHRRAALVHTAEVKSRANPGGDAHPRITGITVMRHEAFDVDDAESVDRMKLLADKHFAEATRPRNHTIPKDPSDPDGEHRQHLRSSMPRSAFSFIIIDDNTKEVIEHSDFLHRRRNFKDSEMPSHFTPEDVQEFKGKFPSLPYNGESIQNALNQVKAYAEKTYTDSEVAPKVLCVEGVRYRSSKISNSPDIQPLRNVTQTPSNSSEMSPAEMIHEANKTQFFTSADSENRSRTVRNCTYVPDVTFNFADNKGDTFSRFIDLKTEYPKDPDEPWIAQITHNEEPLVIPESLQTPAYNSFSQRFFETSQERQQSAAPDAGEPTPPAQEAPAQEAPTQEAPTQEAPTQEAPEPPAHPGADDPDFAKSESLSGERNPDQQAEPEAPAPAPAPEPVPAEPAPAPIEASKPESAEADPDADLYHGPGSYTFGP